MTLVIDSSCVVAALLDAGPVGAWARTLLRQGDLTVPQLLPVEVTSALRRGVLAGRLSSESAALALADLIDLDVDLQPYEPVVRRVWQLRDAVAAYDAWYVALAELLDAPLVTLDTRLVDASGPRCSFVTP